MKEAGTEPDILDCIAEYAYGHRGRCMVDICHGLGDHFQQMAQEQDAIGWRQFMEGMICTRMHSIQSLHHFTEGTQMNPECWAIGLILRLLEMAHGQWIYRNIQIHDEVVGTQATLCKENIYKMK